MSTSSLIQNVDVVNESDGSTDVIIPAKYFWECVECFGENRLGASFKYSTDHFVAHVSTASTQRVQETLRNWKQKD